MNKKKYKIQQKKNYKKRKKRKEKRKLNWHQPDFIIRDCQIAWGGKWSVLVTRLIS